MQEFKRSDRVGSAMQRALSELMPKLKQAPPGMVTIQEVRVSSDLSHAKVYFSVLGAELERTESADGMLTLSLVDPLLTPAVTVRFGLKQADNP